MNKVLNVKYFLQPLLYYFAISTMLSCSWHRKEIAYVKTSYYGSNSWNDTSKTIQKLGSIIKKYDKEGFSYTKYKEYAPYENLAISTWKNNHIQLKDIVLDDYKLFIANKTINDSLNIFDVKYTNAYVDSSLYSGYYNLKLNIFKDINNNTDSVSVKTIQFSDAIGYNNTREFAMDRSISDSLYLWYSQNFPSTEALAIPVAIINSYKMKFLKSSTYQLKYLSSDSTLTQIVKIDSNLIDDKLEVSKKIINTRLFEKSNKDKLYHEIIRTEFTFLEQTFKSENEPPLQLKEFHMDSLTKDTIFKKTITSKKWLYGREFEYTIHGLINEGRHIDDIDSITSPIIYRQINFLVDSNNRVHQMKVIAVAQNGDTLNLFESAKGIARHKNGVYLGRSINSSYSYYHYPKSFPPKYSPQIENYILAPLYYIDKNLNNVPKKTLSKKEIKQLEKMKRKRTKGYHSVNLLFVSFGVRKLINWQKFKENFSNKYFKYKFRKPAEYSPYTKRLEKNRKKGYEKRILGSTMDSNYEIYEIYYKKLGKGNELLLVE